MVTIAERAAMVGFADAVNVSTPFPFVETGLAFSHVWFEEVAHNILEVISTVVELPSVAATLAVFAETDKVAAPAACVTVTVFELTPLADKVTITERVAMVGFADAVRVSMPLPVALIGSTVSHV